MTSRSVDHGGARPSDPSCLIDQSPVRILPATHSACRDASWRAAGRRVPKRHDFVMQRSTRQEQPSSGSRPSQQRPVESQQAGCRPAGSQAARRWRLETQQLAAPPDGIPTGGSARGQDSGGRGCCWLGTQTAARQLAQQHPPESNISELPGRVTEPRSALLQRRVQRGRHAVVHRRAAPRGTGDGCGQRHRPGLSQPSVALWGGRGG